MEPKRFQRPWRVTDIPGGFRVDHANGLALGYFYWWSSPNSAHQAGVLKRDEAMLMAETFSHMLRAIGPQPPRDVLSRAAYDVRLVSNAVGELNDHRLLSPPESFLVDIQCWNISRS
jgi:hypothetical protein